MSLSALVRSEYGLNPLVHTDNFGLHLKYFSVLLTVVKVHSAQLNNCGLMDFFFLNNN